LDLRLPHGKIGIILRCNPWAVGSSPEGTFLGVLYGENRPKYENWATLMPRSSATVRCTEKLTGPWKLPGPWTTTRSKQYLSVVHPLACSECGACLTPSEFGVLGAVSPEWKLFINFCAKSAFHSRFTCRGQIWRKSAVAKLPKSHLVLLTKNPSLGTLLSSPFPPPQLTDRFQNFVNVVGP